MAVTETIILKSDSTQIKTASKDLNGLSTSANKADTSATKTATSFKAMAATAATLAVAVYAVKKAMDAVTKVGFSYNKQLEDSKSGLIALSVAMQDKSIPVTERYAIANKEATQTLIDLQKINAQTPHTLNQTNNIYKAMYPSMKKVGATNKELIELTRSLSIAAGAQNIEFNALLAGVDGLASGTVLANSDLGRFLVSLGVTNKALKESDDVVGMLVETFKDFKAPDTITTALSNLDNEWNILAGDLTKDIFKGSKDGVKELTKLLKNLSDEDLKNIKTGINSFALSSVNAVYGISVGVVELSNAFDSLGARIAGATFQIENGLFLNEAENKALEKMYETTKKQMAARDKILETLKKTKETIEQSIIASSKKKTVITEEDNALTALKEKQEKLAAIERKAAAAKKKASYAQLDIENEKLERAWAIGEAEEQNAIWDAEEAEEEKKRLKEIADLQKEKAAEELKAQKEIADKKLATYRIENEFKRQQAKLIDDETDKKIALAQVSQEEVEFELKAQYEKGDLTEEQYATAMELQDKLFQKTMSDYSKTGQIISEVKDGMQSDFEDFFDYTSDAFMDFGDLANDILKQIYESMVKMSIVKPLTSSLASFATSAFSGGSTASLGSGTSGVSGGMVAALNAKGGAYSSPSLSSYSGKIVSQPTPFMFASGAAIGSSSGIMGEAGAEAILPLTRTASGDLGVQTTGGSQAVTINIKNESGEQMEATSSEASFDMKGMVIDIVMDSVNRNVKGSRDMFKGLR